LHLCNQSHPVKSRQEAYFWCHSGQRTTQDPSKIVGPPHNFLTFVGSEMESLWLRSNLAGYAKKHGVQDFDLWKLSALPRDFSKLRRWLSPLSWSFRDKLEATTIPFLFCLHSIETTSQKL
jgi:hypothetical protein